MIIAVCVPNRSVLGQEAEGSGLWMSAWLAPASSLPCRYLTFVVIGVRVDMRWGRVNNLEGKVNLLYVLIFLRFEDNSILGFILT